MSPSQRRFDRKLLMEESPASSAPTAREIDLFKSILGYLKPRSGRVIFSGEDITGYRPDLNCGRGIGYLMEGHSIFPAMTVEENLLLGVWPLRHDRMRVASALEKAYDNAPILRERRRTNAGLLSGGQQRILEIERIGMTTPSLIMLDEPSLGLAPKPDRRDVSAGPPISGRRTSPLS